MHISIIGFFFILTTCFSLMTYSQDRTDSLVPSKTYSVNKIVIQNFEYKSDPNLIWSLANIITDFSYPWREENPSMTLFRALHDDTFFYFRYDVVDPEIHIDRMTGLETDVINSDRVEIFFLANEKMSPYYCLEMDAEGKLFDYKANYYRQNSFDWVWPKEHLELKSFTKSNGYAISGKISLTYLRQIEVLHKNTMYLGLFRADVVGHTNNQPIFKWISWIQPNAKKPDFHIPSAFGKFRLLE